MDFLQVTPNNSVTFIEALGELWKLILLIFLILVFIIYRKKIFYFIKTFNKVSGKVGQSEILLIREEKAELEPISIEKATEEPTAEQKKAGHSKELENTSEPSFLEIYNLLDDRKFYEAEKLFKQLQEKVTDSKEKIQNELMYLYYQYYYGGKNVINDLITKAEEINDNDLKSLAFVYIAYCFEKANDYEKSNFYFNRGNEYCKEEKEIIGNEIKIAENVRQIKGNNEAIEFLLSKLSELKDDLNKSKVYHALAELYQKNNQEDKRLLCLLQASRYDPNNTSKLFDLAYFLNSTNYKHNQLSAYLYQKIIEFNPKHDMAFNNLGAAFDELNINGEKYKAFIKAKDLGNSLASSNVAKEYIDIGNYKEAKQILNEAAKDKNVHENIFFYLNDVAQKEKAETDLKGKIFEDAQLQILFLTKISDVCFIQLQQPFSWGKTLVSDKGTLEMQENLLDDKKIFYGN